MELKESPKVRVKITIKWIKKYKELKNEFEINLKNNCKLYTGREKDRILEWFGIEKEFFNAFDIVGKFGNTTKQSYILKEKISDPLTTSVIMFNEKDHLKEHIKYMKKFLEKVVNEHRSCRYVLRHKKIYSWEQYQSISDVNFSVLTFSQVMYSSLPILFGWLILPITKILNICFNTEKYFNQSDLGSISLAEALQIIATNITKTDVIITFIIIPAIFFAVCIVKWRQKQNVIRF